MRHGNSLFAYHIGLSLRFFPHCLLSKVDALLGDQVVQPAINGVPGATDQILMVHKHELTEPERERH